jgi:large subunit ribosomal protein L15
MPANKRKKTSRFKGSRSYGHGLRKKPRGAGHRGGRGNAGSGKRADQNKPSSWKDLNYFGKHGFINKGASNDIKAVNTEYLEQNIDRLVSEKKAEFKNGIYVIDLGKIGYDKLLCKGFIKRKYNITCLKASKGAKEKVEAAGGSLNLSGSEKPEKAEESGQDKEE